jgi:hypothetical protein
MANCKRMADCIGTEVHFEHVGCKMDGSKQPAQGDLWFAESTIEPRRL